MAIAIKGVRDLARKHTRAAINTLVTICKDEKQQPAARVAAANSLLDRGYGRAPQHIDHEIQGEMTVADRTSHRLLEKMRAEIAGGPEAVLGGEPDAGLAESGDVPDGTVH